MTFLVLSSGGPFVRGTGTIRIILVEGIMRNNDLQNFPAKSSWAKSVKSLLDNLGFGHVWIEQGVGNINMFLRISKKD